MSFRSTAVVFGVAAASMLMVLTPVARAQRKVSVWMTTADSTNLLKEQPKIRWKKGGVGDGIVIDDAKTYQTMDGFGHAVTGGSAELLMKMSPTARGPLLQELFGHGPKDINTSYIRVSVGSSDMNDHAYTYDDLASGETDPELKHFSMAEDEKYVLPVLRQIVAIQPGIKILASPWSAPAWMKDNDNLKGGSLKPEYYSTYARYWVMYLKEMQAHGITIDALTPQNEPENPKNTPSMLVTAEQEAEFIGKYLGPALEAAGLKTKIITFDHNCDHPIYPETILRDAEAAKYVDGSGFHLYEGDISALTEVHDAFPQKNIYFTEQTVIARRESTEMEIAQPEAQIEIAAPNNWSRNVLLWNLAADAENGPHTNNGGCPVCSGALRIEGDKVTRLVAYYVAAHASKFVPPGSVRIGSQGPAASVPHVAYRTPQGGHVLVASNPSASAAAVVLRYKGKEITAQLPAGAVATYVW